MDGMKQWSSHKVGLTATCSFPHFLMFLCSYYWRTSFPLWENTRGICWITFRVLWSVTSLSFESLRLINFVIFSSLMLHVIHLMKRNLRNKLNYLSWCIDPYSLCLLGHRNSHLVAFSSLLAYSVSLVRKYLRNQFKLLSVHNLHLKEITQISDPHL